MWFLCLKHCLLLVVPLNVNALHNFHLQHCLTHTTFQNYGNQWRLLSPLTGICLGDSPHLECGDTNAITRHANWDNVGTVKRQKNKMPHCHKYFALILFVEQISHFTCEGSEPTKSPTLTRWSLIKLPVHFNFNWHHLSQLIEGLNVSVKKFRCS